MKRNIPLSVPNFEGNEKKYVDEAIKDAWVSTGGAFINRLETEMVGFLQTGAVAACQSGTSAIHLSLIEAGVEPGDVVIVPTLTFIAAVNPVCYQFANPVFMDCDDSLCMDPVKLRRFCEEECIFENNQLYFRNAKVKTIVVVHVFGNMADMESIMDIANIYNLQVIEDATEALGTRYTQGKYAGQFAGTIGDFGAFSFNGNKIITTGGGGAVTAKDEGKVAHMRYLSTQAKDDALFYVHNEVGYNYRMTNLQAALGVAQLEELPEFIERKQRNYEKYRELLKDRENVELMGFREETFSNRWFYSLLLNIDKMDRPVRELVNDLKNEGIQTRMIWDLIHKQKPYENQLAYKIEKAEYYSRRILNIPCSTNLTEEEIEYVAEKIKAALPK